MEAALQDVVAARHKRDPFKPHLVKFTTSSLPKPPNESEGPSGPLNTTNDTKKVVEEASANVSLRVELLRSMRTTLLREMDEAMKLTEAAAPPSGNKRNPRKTTGGAKNKEQETLNSANADRNVASYYDSGAYDRMQRVLSGEENALFQETAFQASINGFPPSRDSNNTDPCHIDYSLCLNLEAEIPAQSLSDFLESLEEKVIRSGAAAAAAAAVEEGRALALEESSNGDCPMKLINTGTEALDYGTAQGNTANSVDAVQILSHHVKILEERGIMPMPQVTMAALLPSTTAAGFGGCGDHNDRMHLEGATWLAPSGAVLTAVSCSTPMDLQMDHFDHGARSKFEWPEEIGIEEEREEESMEIVQEDRSVDLVRQLSRKGSEGGGSEDKLRGAVPVPATLLLPASFVRRKPGQIEASTNGLDSILPTSIRNQIGGSDGMENGWEQLERANNDDPSMTNIVNGATHNELQNSKIAPRTTETTLRPQIPSSTPINPGSNTEVPQEAPLGLPPPPRERLPVQIQIPSFRRPTLPPRPITNLDNSLPSDDAVIDAIEDIDCDNDNNELSRDLPSHHGGGGGGARGNVGGRKPEEGLSAAQAMPPPPPRRSIIIPKRGVNTRPVNRGFVGGQGPQPLQLITPSALLHHREEEEQGGPNGEELLECEGNANAARGTVNGTTGHGTASGTTQTGINDSFAVPSVVRQSLSTLPRAAVPSSSILGQTQSIFNQPARAAPVAVPVPLAVVPSAAVPNIVMPANEQTQALTTEITALPRDTTTRLSSYGAVPIAVYPAVPGPKLKLSWDGQDGNGQDPLVLRPSTLLKEWIGTKPRWRPIRRSEDLLLPDRYRPGSNNIRPISTNNSTTRGTTTTTLATLLHLPSITIDPSGMLSRSLLSGTAGKAQQHGVKGVVAMSEGQEMSERDVVAIEDDPDFVGESWEAWRQQAKILAKKKGTAIGAGSSAGGGLPAEPAEHDLWAELMQVEDEECGDGVTKAQQAPQQAWVSDDQWWWCSDSDDAEFENLENITSAEGRGISTVGVADGIERGRDSRAHQAQHERNLLVKPLAPALMVVGASASAGGPRGGRVYDPPHRPSTSVGGITRGNHNISDKNDDNMKQGVGTASLPVVDIIEITFDDENCTTDGDHEEDLGKDDGGIMHDGTMDGTGTDTAANLLNIGIGNERDHHHGSSALPAGALPQQDHQGIAKDTGGSSHLQQAARGGNTSINGNEVPPMATAITGAIGLPSENRTLHVEQDIDPWRCLDEDMEESPRSNNGTTNDNHQDHLDQSNTDAAVDLCWEDDDGTNYQNGDLGTGGGTLGGIGGHSNAGGALCGFGGLGVDVIMECDTDIDTETGDLLPDNHINNNSSLGGTYHGQKQGTTTTTKKNPAGALTRSREDLSNKGSVLQGETRRSTRRDDVIEGMLDIDSPESGNDIMMEGADLVDIEYDDDESPYEYEYDDQDDVTMTYLDPHHHQGADGGDIINNPQVLKKQRMVAALQAGADRVREAALQEWRAQQRASAIGARLLRPALAAALARKQGEERESGGGGGTPRGVLLSVLRKECASKLGGVTPPFPAALSVLLSIVHAANTSVGRPTPVEASSMAMGADKSGKGEMREATAEEARSASVCGPLWLQTARGKSGDVEIRW